MKVRVMSDVHLDFSDLVVSSLPDDLQTVLVVAGDLVEVRHIAVALPFLERASKGFREVVLIPGNHEYYNGSIQVAEKKLRDAIEPFANITLLQNSTKIVDKVAFIGTTLWSDFDKENPLAMNTARFSMNDYYLIRTGRGNPYERRLQPIDTLKLHKVAKKWLFEEIINQKNQGNVRVVITHHHPSYRGLDVFFKGDNLNGCYYSDLDALIEKTTPEFWLCGHTHHFVEYNIGPTSVICNPRGYTHSSGVPSQNTGFDPVKVFEV